MIKSNQTKVKISMNQNDPTEWRYKMWRILRMVCVGYRKKNDWNGINSKNTAGILIQFTQFQYFVCSICAFDLIKGKQWRQSKEKKKKKITQ